MVRRLSKEQVLNYLPKAPHVQIVEVSTGETYLRGHLPGAIQLSLPEICNEPDKHIPNRKNPVVLYGLSKDSQEPVRAANFLDAIGYEFVLLYPEGKDKWMASGLPIESFATDYPGPEKVREYPFPLQQKWAQSRYQIRNEQRAA